MIIYVFSVLYFQIKRMAKVYLKGELDIEHKVIKLKLTRCVNIELIVEHQIIKYLSPSKYELKGEMDSIILCFLLRSFNLKRQGLPRSMNRRVNERRISQKLFSMCMPTLQLKPEFVCKVAVQKMKLSS